MVNLLELPKELVQDCIKHLSSVSLTNFAKTSQRCRRFALDPQLWRNHCVAEFAYWSHRHGISRKLKLPVRDTDWRELFLERKRIDEAVLRTLNSLINDNSNRIAKIHDIALFEDDAKDVLLRNLEAPDDSEDVLARRYYSFAVLSHLNRLSACRTWWLWRKHEIRGHETVPDIYLEHPLVAFDVFISQSAGEEAELLNNKLEEAACQIKLESEDWKALTLLEKSYKLAEHIASRGNVREREAFPSLEGCLIYRSSKTELAISSKSYIVCAIYCALARRLGFEAHMISVGLDTYYNMIRTGKNRIVDGETQLVKEENEVLIDPWSAPHLPTKADIIERARASGTPTVTDKALSTPLKPIRLLQRIAHDIVTAASRRGAVANDPFVDYQAARYAALWASVILYGRWTDDLEDDDPMSAAQDIIGILKTIPEDWRLFTEFIMPLFSRSPHLEDMAAMLNEIKEADTTPHPTKPRNETTRAVKHYVGQMVRHRRYGWEGVITGWDLKCSEGDAYCQAYGVYGLPNGRNQPFYQVLTNVEGVARSSRYVAQDNVDVVQGPPNDDLMQLAGQKFKRWDSSKGIFVSNIRHEYPDD